MSKFLGGVLQGNETVFLTQDEINNPYADIPTMIEDKKRKQEQPKPTVFDSITASPEVLAEKLVYNKMYMIQDGVLQYWVSSYFSTIIKGKSWEYETEAIAATVAKLKEVCND